MRSFASAEQEASRHPTRCLPRGSSQTPPGFNRQYFSKCALNSGASSKRGSGWFCMPVSLADKGCAVNPQVFAAPKGPCPPRQRTRSRAYASPLVEHVQIVGSVRRSGRPGVAQQATKDVGEEIREQSGFLEIVHAAGTDEAGPVLDFRLPVAHTLRQV